MVIKWWAERKEGIVCQAVNFGYRTKIYKYIDHVKFDVILFFHNLQFQFVNIRNEAYQKAFGENLKRIRNSKKISRETLGAEAGIEPKQVYLIEVGKNSPTLATIVAVAGALGVHPKKLFDFEFNL
jgi:DNA-binding XRE family transcriptional regulator